MENFKSISMTEATDALTAAVQTKDPHRIDEATKNFLVLSKDALADWLDKKNGAGVTENSIFETLPRYWEDAFHKDMAALNVSYKNRWTIFHSISNKISN